MVKKLKFEDRGKDTTKYTWASVDHQDRPVKGYRDVTKGKNKGMIQVTLFDGKKKVLPRSQVRFAGKYCPTGKVGTAYVYELVGK